MGLSSGQARVSQLSCSLQSLYVWYTHDTNTAILLAIELAALKFQANTVNLLLPKTFRPAVASFEFRHPLHATEMMSRTYQFTPLLQPQQHCCCLPIPPPTTPTQAAAKQLRLSDTLTPAFVMNLHVPSTLPSPSFVLLPSEAVQFSRMNFMLLGMITTFKIQNSNMIIMIMMVWL
jgi:hypothetical protein